MWVDYKPVDVEIDNDKYRNVPCICNVDLE